MSLIKRKQVSFNVWTSAGQFMNYNLNLFGINCLCMQNAKIQFKQTDLSMKPTVLYLLFPVELFL